MMSFLTLVIGFLLGLASDTLITMVFVHGNKKLRDDIDGIFYALDRIEEKLDDITEQLDDMTREYNKIDYGE